MELKISLKNNPHLTSQSVQIWYLLTDKQQMTLIPVVFSPDKKIPKICFTWFQADPLLSMFSNNHLALSSSLYERGKIKATRHGNMDNLQE